MLIQQFCNCFSYCVKTDFIQIDRICCYTNTLKFLKIVFILLNFLFWCLVMKVNRRQMLPLVFWQNIKFIIKSSLIDWSDKKTIYSSIFCLLLMVLKIFSKSVWHEVIYLFLQKYPLKNLPDLFGSKELSSPE